MIQRVWVIGFCLLLGVSAALVPPLVPVQPAAAALDIWEPTGGLAVARREHTLTLLADGRALAAGGRRTSGVTATAEVYDPAAGTFASIGGAASQEIAPASRLTDGTVLIAGGQVPGGHGSADAELYVPASGTFEFAGEMTAGRHSHTATPLPDDTVLITGGFSVWPAPTSSAEVYQPR